MNLRLILVVISSFLCFSVKGQTAQKNAAMYDSVVARSVVAADDMTSRFGVSTNIVDWAWYITPNIEFQFAMNRHWTMDFIAKYNAWTFMDNDALRRDRQCRQEYSCGFHYWPWYTYSGWWFGVATKYQEYSKRNFQNIFRKEEGDAFGVSLSAGYSVHVKSWFNIDFGVGFWGGRKYYKVYESVDKACPECGKRVDRIDGNGNPSRAFFFLPDFVSVSLMFIL